MTNKGTNTFNFSFVPRIGYRMANDRLEVGAALRLQYDETMSYVIKSDQKTLEKNVLEPDFTIYVSPYVRYLFLQKGFFNLGLEGVVDLGWGLALADKQYANSHVSVSTADAYNKAAKDYIAETKPGDFRWGLNIRPVMVFNLTDHWMMDITLDALGFSAIGNVTNYNTTALGKEVKVMDSNARIQLNLMSPEQQLFTVGCAYKF